MITLTVPHNINKWGKKVNTGHNIIQSWENLKQGWNRLRMCQVFKNRDFIIIYEPHPETGYPHAHMMVFSSFIEDEIKHIKELWHDMTGADIENGIDFNPGIGITTSDCLCHEVYVKDSLSHDTRMDYGRMDV